MVTKELAFAQPATVPMKLGAVPTKSDDRERNPVHLAIVLQGHRQWAQEHAFSYAHAVNTAAGRLLELVDFCAMRFIPRVTLCVFSEDLQRRSLSSDGEFFSSFMRYVTAAAQNLHRNDVRVQIVGPMDRLDSTTRGLLSHVARRTHLNQGMQLVVAIDGFADVGQAGKMADEVDIALTAVDPEPRVVETPDLVIRTGGSMPVHRSMLWDTRRTALFFTDRDWPAFDAGALRAALEWYGEAHRSVGIDSPTPLLVGERSN